MHHIPVFTFMTNGCLLLTHLFSVISVNIALNHILSASYIFVAYSIGLPSSYLA